MEIIEYPKNIPKGNQYVYHTTDNIDLRTLCRKGIDNTVQSKKWIYLNKFLEQVANIENIRSKPKNRGECVFAYSRYNDVYDNKKTIVVIDLTKINYNIYRASYHTITQIYNIVKNTNVDSSIYLLDKKDINVKESDAYSKAIKYWENMDKISNGTSKGGEILIDGYIKPEYITHVVK